jgi:Tfp pilus assembly protein PilP
VTDRAKTKSVWMTAVAIAASAMVSAQGAPAANPQAPVATAPQQGAPPPALPPPAPESYSYDPAGRRDPFVSLVSRGTEPVSGSKAAGIGGISTAEVVVRGVLHSRGNYVALVSGPEGKTFTARVNDRLLDGTIRSITPQGIVVMQEVNDPLSLIRQREVRKGLRTADDGKN